MSDLGIDALQRAKELLGGQTALAKIVGVEQPHVHYALTKAKKVPAEWCIAIDQATAAKGNRVSCHDLRPDLWPQDFEPQKAA